MVAIIAIFAYNPTKAINTTMAVVQSTTAAGQWVCGEWVMIKLAIIDWIKQASQSKVSDLIVIVIMLMMIV